MINYVPKIKEYIERYFLAQVGFAELLGVDKTTVTRWETGWFKLTIKKKKDDMSFSKKLE